MAEKLDDERFVIGDDEWTIKRIHAIDDDWEGDVVWLKNEFNKNGSLAAVANAVGISEEESALAGVSVPWIIIERLIERRRLQAGK